MTLKITISGVRGLIGESLTDDVVINFATAFAKHIGNTGTVVIASDARPSRDHIADLVIRTLSRNGIKPVFIGIAPTPTAQIYVRHLSAAGGIVITASHNPIEPKEWNGLKFINSSGVFLNETQANAMFDIYYKMANTHAAKREFSSGFFEHDEKSLSCHIEKVLRCVDTQEIRKNKFKVAIDCCNGAGCVITKMLLRELGADIYAINDKPGAPTPRVLEPLPENLGQLEKITSEFGCDIGFAQDPDADRLAIVSDNGIAIGEEYSLVFAADFILHKLRKIKSEKIAVTNLSTSAMIDAIAAKYGAKVLRSKVGEINVSETMMKTGAVIGGEGNGGIILPEVGFGRDSLSGIAIILNYLAATGKKVSELVDPARIPKYFMLKDKIEMTDQTKIDHFLAALKEEHKNDTLDLQDGIKAITPSGWMHARGSNTEPIVRIIAEGADQTLIKQTIEKAKTLAATI